MLSLLFLLCVMECSIAAYLLNPCWSSRNHILSQMSLLCSGQRAWYELQHDFAQLSCLEAKAWLTFLTYQTGPYEGHTDGHNVPAELCHGWAVGRTCNLIVFSVICSVKWCTCSGSWCVTAQLVVLTTLDSHDVSCLCRCCGKSPGSSCWLLSSALWSWDLLSVRLLSWFQFSFILQPLWCVCLIFLTTCVFSVKPLSLCVHQVTWRANPA